MKLLQKHFDSRKNLIAYVKELAPSCKIGEQMPKGIKKANLPTKICPRCGRPFSWRKKWEKVWNEVKYCSDKCKK